EFSKSSECAGPADVSPGNRCSPGFFCPERSSLPQICTAGYYCDQYELAEPTGFYQARKGQPDCNACPAGSYCYTPELENWGVEAPQRCPPGHFCPPRTEFATQYKCPRGTFSNKEGLTSAAECDLCPPGQFCSQEGLVKSSGSCFPGFYCLRGTMYPNPTDGITGDICPMGKYCEAGSTADGESGGVCPGGFYCQAGTHSPVPCPITTFLNHSGGAECDVCPAGFYCIHGNGINPCPLGFYCPEGTGATISPCPAGTYGGRIGLKEENECLPCTGGFYCAQDGLPSPQGKCDLGHYCISGVNIPNPGPTQLFLGSGGKCGIGQQCPSGSVLPQPCPSGTYTEEEGLGQCRSCPAGYYCLLTLMIPELCLPGYYCLPGTEEATQYPCRPGTYNGRSGTSGVRNNITRWVGFAQQVITVHLDLPVQYRVMEGNTVQIQGLPCHRELPFHCHAREDLTKPTKARNHVTHVQQVSFVGSLMVLVGNCLNCVPQASSVQLALLWAQSIHVQRVHLALVLVEPMSQVVSPVHQVCIVLPMDSLILQDRVTLATTVLEVPSAQLLSSIWHVCHAGSTMPRPSDGIQGYVCPRGFRCPAGTINELPCKAGTYNPSSGAGICLPCPAGAVCANSSTVEPAACPRGYYCLSRTTFPLPCPEGTYNTLDGASSAAGHFCPEGSGFPIPCPAGKYQPNKHSDVCIPCRAGFYCEETATVKQILCPPHFYCPEGTQIPFPCQSGTFTPGQTSGLKEERECIPCPTGTYCSRGKIQGFCAAGYFCLAGSYTSTPQGRLPNATNDLDLCFYCPKGTEAAKACPANTIRLLPGGRQLEECQPCPPGHLCKEGDPVLYRCPAGYFCDGVIQAPFQFPAGPQKCPIYTYSNVSGAASQAACQPCPPGYHCKETGLSTYENDLCPLGYWCPGKGGLAFCPGGTLGNQAGAAFYKDCQPCPPGYYCPDPRETGQPNIIGVSCRAGYECPAGSVAEIPCRPGSYCSPMTGNATVCPGGYFCPQGSPTYMTPEQLCVFPYYCPANSSSMLPCDGGYMPVNVAGLRDSLEKACLICEAGTYRKGSAAELHCNTCPAAFHCPAGSENYLSHPCPIGYYCSEMTRFPVPCPPGTYGNTSHAKQHSECYPCPKNMFNHMFAQRACFPCGSTSYSGQGSRTCKCRGFNRAFQESDGSCICKTGYVYYNEADQKSSNSNSDLDCYPEVNDRCSVGEARLASTRRCVLPEHHNCTPACGKYGGKLDVELGICHCNKYITAEELCDRVCMAGILNISASSLSTGELVLTIQNGPGVTRDHKNWIVVDVLGPDEHVSDSPRVLFILFEPAGIFGLILSGKNLVDMFLTETERPVIFQNPRFFTKTASYLQRTISTGMNGEIPKIPNPVVCLRPHDLILFKLSIHQSSECRSSVI
ncbi:hypothetical protein scyTo_0016994, partial [Scyliorhinus torazame]|nr:hypothetical protein [Scyliorhinus torazame]